MTEDSVFDLPTASAVDRLIRWHAGSADADGRLALSLAAEGLDEAAEKNRRRSAAHRQTAQFLTILKLKVCTPEREFRGHLEMKNRPKAKVRAPP